MPVLDIRGSSLTADLFVGEGESELMVRARTNAHIPDRPEVRDGPRRHVLVAGQNQFHIRSLQIATH